jgi:tRNA threonylcarbamoyladenosine biosynthesis protein TsaE
LVAIELSAVDRHDPIVESAVASVHWPDELATQLFAARLAKQPALHNAFIALHGDLGAGKTTLVRHLLQALGVQGRIKSPTYAVVESYELPALNIWHFDFYRFNDPQEWEDAGFRDMFASPGLKLVEWPEKAAPLLPRPDLDIHLRTASDVAREVSMTARSATGNALLQGCTAARTSL